MILKAISIPTEGGYFFSIKAHGIKRGKQYHEVQVLPDYKKENAI